MACNSICYNQDHDGPPTDRYWPPWATQSPHQTHSIQRTVTIFATFGWWLLIITKTGIGHVRQGRTRASTLPNACYAKNCSPGYHPRIRLAALINRRKLEEETRRFGMRFRATSNSCQSHFRVPSFHYLESVSCFTVLCLQTNMITLSLTALAITHPD